MKLDRVTLSLVLASLLAGCGGGGGGGSTPAAPAPVTVTPPAASADGLPAPGAYKALANLCERPRTGVDADGQPFPDRQGSLRNEQDFLRSWIHDTYLWYKEVPSGLNPANYPTAIAWFDVLKTPAITASGKPKDQYHFTYPTAEWEALQSTGVALGYGVTWSRSASSALPRMWFVTQVEPNSPAGRAGLRRGDQLLEIDGVDFMNNGTSSGVATLNAGLSPDTVGESHRFVVRRNGESITVTLQAANVAFTPVQNVKTFDTPTGKVGYMTFNSHNAVSELQLINAFTSLRNDGVNDLVLDLRYNGGGLLYLAAEVAYMIAGPANTAGKVFERTIYNDKTPPDDPIPFRSTAYGFQTANPARAGQALPTLNLKRVTILTTPGTCSASESVINGLRGADVEVNLIGGKTCGKPYGFLPQPNCGTTYFSVQLQGTNHKGFGDYADGMAPTCTVADDYGHSLGDQNEGMLAAALRYRNSGTCDAPVRALARPLELVRHPAETAKIVPPR